MPTKEMNAVEKMVGAFEARRQLGKILKDVAGKGDHYVVQYHGEPVAVVVPMALYSRWKQRRESFFDRLEQMAATAELSPAEAEELAAEAVAAARDAQRDGTVGLSPARGSQRGVPDAS